MRKPTRFFSAFLAFFSVLLSGIIAPNWFTPISRASAAITTAECAQTVGNNAAVTISVVGNDCILVFSSDTSWTIPAAITSIQLLLVGGGAAGQLDGGGGGGGGAGYYNASISVTPGTVTNVDVGAGGRATVFGVNNAEAGSTSRIDLNNDSSFEYTANGGSVGGGWETRTGGNGGTSTTSTPGGSGGNGPTSTSSGDGTGSAGQNGFTSDITGTTYSYGGGGGGGVGSHSNGNITTDLGFTSGGQGGGGAGAAQRTRGTNLTWTYTGVPSASLTRTANCAANISFPGSTRGFDGLDGFGGGGGGGSAYGDGCKGSTDTTDDGERNSGGDGGDGVVIVRYTVAETPVISSQPANNTTTLLNGNASFSVTAAVSDGGTLSYQWQESTNSGSSWTDISGATSATFTKNSVTSAMDLYQYRVVITNTITGNTSSVTSNSATLTLKRVGDATCKQLVSVETNFTATISADSNYCILQFKNVGTTQWVVPAGVASGRVLVVAGGGGGGHSDSGRTGGGGGGGGFFEANSVPLSGVLSLQVGDGGVGSLDRTKQGSDGGDSFFDTLKAGGGGGANAVGYSGRVARNGLGGSDYVSSGSGGGARANNFREENSIGGSAGAIASAPGVSFGGSNFLGQTGVAAAAAFSGDTASGSNGGQIATASLRTSDISGTSVIYSKGGPFSPYSAGSKTPGSGGAANYSYNGTVSVPNPYTSDAGAAGIVIVRYALSDVPNQVTGLSATAGSGEVALSWSAPSDGGSAITDYVIEQSINNSTWTTVADGTSTATSYTVTGLTVGQIYYFRVSAKNDIGSGAVSTVVSATPASEIDYSLDFDGTFTATANVAAVPEADNAEFSVESWVWADAIGSGTYRTIFTQGQVSSSQVNRFWLGFYQSGSAYYVAVGRKNDLGINFQISNPIGRWVHVAATVTSSNSIAIYIDGNLISTVNSANTANTGTSAGVGIGSDDNGVGNKFDGRIDQVKVWNGALTQAEIALSMNTWGKPASGVDNTLRAHWDFNDAATSTLDDKAGAYDLTLASVESADYEDIKSENTISGNKVVSFARSYLTAFGGWKVPSGISSVRALVVGGGGGGGSDEGGGGGAGGFIDASSVSVTAGNYEKIQVGQGGIGAKSESQLASQGQNSQFTSSSTYAAVGGGSGGTAHNSDANARKGGAGGSGGGAAGEARNNSGGARTAGQGNIGGGGATSDWGHGGGGAGAAGGRYVSPLCYVCGGIGATSNITGSTLYYAGGGGGGGGNTRGAVPGGTQGGGGTGGGTNGFPVAGTANTGGGGGGGGNETYGEYQGAPGGSGIVILRYELFTPPSISSHPASATVLAGNNTTLSVTATNATSYQWQVSTNGGVSWSNTGTDSASLTLSAVTSSMNTNQYRVVVTRTVGGESASVTSNIAILTVENGATVTGAFCDNTYTKNGLTVGAGHGEVFYIDTGQGQEIDAGYIAYSVESDTARSDLWVEVSSFTGGVVSLANPNDSSQPLGTVTAGGSGTAYFMIKATGGTTAPQAHVVKIYNQKPTIGNPAPIYTCSFTFVEVAETIKAAANKVNSITSTTVASLGSTMTITVLGDSGTIGQGNDIDGRMISLTPAARSSWPTNALRLERVTLDLYSNSQRTSLLSSHTNVLRVNATTGLASNNRQYYRAVYTFRVIGAAASTAPIIPIAMISSGTQIKHTDVGSLPTGGTATVDLRTPAIDLTVTKSVNSTTTVGNDGITTLGYTITMTNGGSNALVIDEVVDDPDTNLTFVPGSAEFNGASISDPGIITGGKVAFSGPMNLPANASRTITYSMKFETCSVGSTYSFDNVATARTGTVVIGSGSASQTAVNIAGNCGQTQATVTITEEPIPPEVITGNASLITDSSATISGVVDPNGDSGLAVRFTYGTSSTLASGNTTVNLSNTTFATDGYGVSTDLTSLSGNTTYYYRLEVQDADGNWVLGTIRNFKTLPTPGTPDAVTQTANAITTSAATLNGTIQPNYVAGGSKARFDWATDGSSGSCTSLGTTQTSGVLQSEGASGNEDAVLAGGAPTAMTHSISGLVSGDYYCFRIVALYSTGYTTTDVGSWVSFVVTAKTAQSITWGTSASPLPAGGSTTVSATASSSLAVTYTSADTSICTVNSLTGAVTAVANSGTCTITASQAGNSTYYAAVPKTISFLISPPIITPAILVSGTYQTSGYSQTLVATGGNGTYSSWTVAGGSLPTGLSLNSSTGIISGTPTAAGIFNFTVTVVSNGVTSVTESFRITIAKAPVVVTASSPTVVFGAAAPTVTPSYSGFIGSDQSTLANSPNIAPTCTSTYVVGAAVSVTPTTSCNNAWHANYIFSYVAGAITITPFPITITALDATKQNIVDGSNTEVTQDPSLRYIISPALPAGQSITDALPGGVTITRANSGTGIATLLTSALPAGEVANSTHDITVSATPGANYSVTTANGTFTVQTPKQVPTLIASNKTITYGDIGVPTTIGAIARARDLTSISGTFNYYKIEQDLTETEIDANTLLDAGLYSIKIKFTATDTSSYISPIYTTINLTVNKKAVIVTAADKKKIEGQLDPTLTWSASGLIGSDASTIIEPITISRIGGEAPGSYVISTSGGGHPNYSISRVDGTFFISKLEITVTASRGILTSKTVQANCEGAKPGATATFTIETTSPTTTLGTATVQSDGSCPMTATIPDDVDQGNHTLKIATLDPLNGSINTTNRIAFIASAIITNISGGGSGGGGSGGGGGSTPTVTTTPTVSPSGTTPTNNRNRIPTPRRTVFPNNPLPQTNPLPTPGTNSLPQSQGPTNVPGATRPIPEVQLPALPGLNRLLTPNSNNNSESQNNSQQNNQGTTGSNPQTQLPAGSLSQRTVDFGTGVKTAQEVIDQDISPTGSEGRRSLDEIKSEKLGGFTPGGLGTRIEIIGARTNARFVVSEQSQIDTITLIEAIKRSIPTQTQDFAEITNIVESQTPNLPNEWSEAERNYAAEIFAASGLGEPVNLRDLYSDQFNSWLKVSTQASTYLPGSIVYLTVTSDPLVIGSAVVDNDGFVQVAGDMPIQWLQTGEHRIRLVGIRALDGVTVDDQGEVQLSADLITEIEKFDLGTQATVTVIGPNESGGEHAALRVVPLAATAPWWTLLIILGVGLIGIYLRRKNYLTAKRLRYSALAAVGLSSLPAVIIGWISTVTIVVWVGIGATLASLALNWITPEKRSEKNNPENTTGNTPEFNSAAN